MIEKRKYIKKMKIEREHRSKKIIKTEDRLIKKRNAIMKKRKTLATQSA